VLTPDFLAVPSGKGVVLEGTPSCQRLHLLVSQYSPFSAGTLGPLQRCAMLCAFIYMKILKEREAGSVHCWTAEVR